MGNLIAGTTIQGRTFNDIAIQKSKEGVPRPIVFGVARPIVGNVIATTEPKIITVREEAGGKGGGTEVENQEVYRSYAIRICEGPATVRRVWRNNKLVFDARVELPGITAEELGGVEDLSAHIAAQTANNNAFRNIATFYSGSFSQMPSPVLEAIYGIGNVPAHRGTCYMVIDNENLTDNGGAIPQYAFEVVRSEGFVLTSKPYPLDDVEGVNLSVYPVRVASRAMVKRAQGYTDSVKISSQVFGCRVRSIYREYDISEGVRFEAELNRLVKFRALVRLYSDIESVVFNTQPMLIRVDRIAIRPPGDGEIMILFPGVSGIRVI